MNDLIEGALRLAIAREGMNPQSARLQVKNVVSAAVTDTSVAAAAKDIKLDALGDDDLEIDADQRLMSSVLNPSARQCGEVQPKRRDGAGPLR